MKELSYFILQNDISNGEEPILAKTSYRCQDSDFDDQYEVAIEQAYNGEVAVEDDVQPEPEPTEQEQLRADVDFLLAMGGVL